MPSMGFVHLVNDLWSGPFGLDLRVITSLIAEVEPSFFLVWKDCSWELFGSLLGIGPRSPLSLCLLAIVSSTTSLIFWSCCQVVNTVTPI